MTATPAVATASAVNAGSALVSESSLPFTDLCALLNERIEVFLREDSPAEQLRNVQAQTRISLDVISEALDRYSLDELSLAYNGGKDCLVLLILFLSALHSKGLTTSVANKSKRIHCVYIQAAHPFEEVEQFVASSVETYGLTLATYAAPMKAAFADYLRDYPSVKAIAVGTRRTDPHGAKLTFFDPTDHGWPKFMRVHPVIDWHYAEIWTFIRHLQIPYCILYDFGYTSLGGTNDTYPNPALRRTQDGTEQNGIASASSKFRPAYELIEDEEERLGRPEK